MEKKEDYNEEHRKGNECKKVKKGSKLGKIRKGRRER